MTYSLRGLLALPLAPRGLAPVALALFAFGAAGCVQGIGDRCQLDSDCASGLTCVIPAGISAAVGGTCEGPSEGGVGSDMAVPLIGDLASTPDLSATPDLPPAMPDQASGADLASKPVVDMTAVIDLSRSPDLVIIQDLAPLVDARSGG